MSPLLLLLLAIQELNSCCFFLFTFLSFPFPLFLSEFVVAAEFLSGRGGFLIFLFYSGYNRNKRFYQNGLGLKYQIE